MPEYRLIVTGSREYDDRMALRAALDKILDSLRADVTLVVVHGGEEIPEQSFAIPDRIAGEWAVEAQADGLPVRQEAHPADWYGPCRETCEPAHRRTWRGDSMCPAAGPYRNREMVDKGADKILGALRSGTRSTGSKGCLKMAAAAGIPFELLWQGRDGGRAEFFGLLAGRRDQGRPPG